MTLLLVETNKYSEEFVEIVDNEIADYIVTGLGSGLKEYVVNELLRTSDYNESALRDLVDERVAVICSFSPRKNP